MVSAAKNLRAIVEGTTSARWIAFEQPGLRLKDTREWCAFYSALAKFNL